MARTFSPAAADISGVNFTVSMLAMASFAEGDEISMCSAVSEKGKEKRKDRNVTEYPEVSETVLRISSLNSFHTRAWLLCNHIVEARSNSINTETPARKSFFMARSISRRCAKNKNA
ncbi:MAG: hypothetical protein WCV56_04845 [Candidatus Omnitrophota bacterium]